MKPELEVKPGLRGRAQAGVEAGASDHPAPPHTVNCHPSAVRRLWCRPPYALHLLSHANLTDFCAPCKLDVNWQPAASPLHGRPVPVKKNSFFLFPVRRGSGATPLCKAPFTAYPDQPQLVSHSRPTSRPPALLPAVRAFKATDMARKGPTVPCSCAAPLGPTPLLPLLLYIPPPTHNFLRPVLAGPFPCTHAQVPRKQLPGAPLLGSWEAPDPQAWAPA
jgi:hypothetical protein